MSKISGSVVGSVLLGCLKVIVFPVLFLGIGFLFVYVIPFKESKVSNEISFPTPCVETDEEYERRMMLDEAYQRGYDDGRNDGYNNGYDEGSETGYNAGYDEGEDFGYMCGFEDGRRNVYDDLRDELLELYDIDIADYLEYSVNLP